MVETIYINIQKIYIDLCIEMQQKNQQKQFILWLCVLTTPNVILLRAHTHTYTKHTHANTHTHTFNGVTHDL